MSEPFDQAKKLQRDAKRLFEASAYEEAYPVYLQAALAFRALDRIPWTNVFFCDATAVRCLEELAQQDVGHLAKYTRSLSSFLSEWSEATVSSRISKPDRRRQALATRLWRQSAQYAVVEDFAAARRILDDALSDLRRRPAKPSQEVEERLIRSKRAAIDALEETRKPLAFRNLERVVTAYLSAARICRLPRGTRGKRDLLEVKLWAFRAVYLSHAFSWSASDCLRASAKGSLPPHIAFSLAASRFERAFRLVESALNAAKDEGFPAAHRHFLNYWRWMIRSRAGLLQFAATALRADGHASTSAMRRQRRDTATTDAGYNRVAASCKVHLVRPTCFMYVAKSQ
jgi:hypothetical protein